MKKTIKTVKIDTGGHGYLSVSKKDFLLVCSPGEISHFSGHNYTRMYLEEDCDATLFRNRADALGYQVEIKESYNLKFPINYGYKPELFHYLPKCGDKLACGPDATYTVDWVNAKKEIGIRHDITGKLYKIGSYNPFCHITGVIASEVGKLAA